MRQSFVVCFAMLGLVACNKDKAAVPDAQAPTPVTAAATASALPSASASAAPSAKPAANKPKPVKGCPDGWTRTTKGICVDWCEVDDDCDDGKTCQDSPHIDPDLGKIKTCQPPKTAAPSDTCAGSKVSDEVECESKKCAEGWVFNGSPATGNVCARKCKTEKDCAVKGNVCYQGACISSQGE